MKLKILASGPVLLRLKTAKCMLRPKNKSPSVLQYRAIT
jgi:hypothetical protein